MLECWSVWECWSVGVECGVLECWSVGVLECWSAGVLECWSAGVLECWSAGFRSSIVLVLADRGKRSVLALTSERDKARPKGQKSMTRTRTI